MIISTVNREATIFPSSKMKNTLYMFPLNSVRTSPFPCSQSFHKFAKISAKCYDSPFHAANTQKVSISCNYSFIHPISDNVDC